MIAKEDNSTLPKDDPYLKAVRGRDLVAIVGAGRNGSTLLTQLLDGSPDIWVHPIDLNYLSFFSDLKKYGRLRKNTVLTATIERPLVLEGEVDTDSLLQFFGRHYEKINQAYAHAFQEDIKTNFDPVEKIRQKSAYGAAEFLRVFLENTGLAYDQRAGDGVRLLVFKTLETPYVAEYARLFPEMRFLHIFRHPYSNYSSLKRTSVSLKMWPFWRLGGDELRTFLHRRWIPHARFALPESEKNPQRHFIVRYEDLCADPKETLAEVCRWLGIAPSLCPDMKTTLGGKARLEIGGYSSQQGVRTPASVTANLDEQCAYDEVLTARERDFILLATYGCGRELGYFEAGATLPGKFKVARQWLLPDHWEFKNVGWSWRLLTAFWRRRFYILNSLLRPDEDSAGKTGSNVRLSS